MAGFPITLPDGGTVKIVHKDGGEGFTERFTDEDGNVYMKNASNGGRGFVLVEAAAVTLIGFDEQGDPSVAVEPLIEDGQEPDDGAVSDEEAEPDGGEVFEDSASFVESLDFNDGISVTLESGETADFDLDFDLDPAA